MAIVNEVGLRKMIRERNISGAILIYGDESYLKEHYLKSIVTKTIGKGQREFNEIIFDFKDVDYITLQESVDGIPLMSEKKCVIIRSIDPDKLTDKDLKQLEGIVADVPEYTVFIVYIDNVDWNVKKSSKCRRLLKIFENSGTAAEISKRTASSIVKFLCDKTEKSGCVLSKENAAKLLERVGNDIRTLDNELEKLCLMCGEGEITASHIESAIPETLEKNVFDLSKLMIKHDVAGALSMTEWLLEQREDPIGICSVLSSAFIDLYRARITVNERGAMADVAKAFQYFNTAFRLSNAEKNSANMSMKYIRTCLSLLAECDMKLKSSPVDKNTILEEYIVKLGMVGR